MIEKIKKGMEILKIYRPGKKKRKQRVNKGKNQVSPDRLIDNKRELTPKKRAFAREYVKDYNGTQAAMRAGFSERSAHVIACNLLKELKVRQFIDDQEKNLATRFISSKEKVLKEMSLIAHSDLADYLTEDGDIRISNLKSLPPQISRAIKRVRVHTTKRRVRGKNGEVGDEIIDQHIDFELYDKKGALEAMGRELGMFVEKKELTGKDGQPLVPQGSTRIVFDFGSGDREGG